VTDIPDSANDTDRWLLEIFEEVTKAVLEALDSVAERSSLGERPGQYRIDLAADAAAIEILHSNRLTTLSEESGITSPDNAIDDITIVIDPIDGSTNAAHGIPWYATSICAVGADGTRVALVSNLANGDTYRAINALGAWKNGKRLTTSSCSTFAESIVGLSGFPGKYLGWSQYRALGAASLDICLVAEGVLDCYGSVGLAHLGVWDYIAGKLICEEAGGCMRDTDGSNIVALDHTTRHAIIAAANPMLLDQFYDRINTNSTTG
jgi:fructose-1,6-bisphosphatase/inositol monophosphatase family enzyme